MNNTRRNLLIALTVAALVLYSSAIARADYGNVYVADQSTGTIYRFQPNGTLQTNYASAPAPVGLAFDRFGNLFVSSEGGNNHSIVEFSNGFTSTFATVSQPTGIAFDHQGNLFVADSSTFDNSPIYKFTPRGTRTTFASGLSNPTGLAFDGQGNLFVAQASANTVTKYAPNGTSTVVASGLAGPIHIAIDHTGQIYISEFNKQDIVRINYHGIRSIFASGLNNIQSLACDDDGNLYVGDGATHSVYRFDPSGQTKTTIASGIDSPSAITVEPPMAFPLNLSTRVDVEPGDNNTPIAGVIVTGAGTKKLLYRALGPSLVKAGVAGALHDPTLEIRNSSGGLVATNDDWKKSSQASAIEATGLAPTEDFESAIIVTGSAGSATAIMRGAYNNTGIGLIEVYDLSSDTPGHLVNISTRGLVGTGDKVMIAGFILGGFNGEARVLVRALGPSLTATGISNALHDPTFVVRNADGWIVTSNDDWEQNQPAEIVETGIAPHYSSEAASVASLPAGAYTVVVSGYNNSSGVGLVEVYNLQ